jgi:uncharacterized membrane protein YGL010W
MEADMEQATPRQIDRLLAIYGESHRNPVNETIHCICVPAIVFSLLGLVWAAHPMAALALATVSLIYYVTLSVPFAIGMLLMSGAMLWLLLMLPQQLIWQISLAIFVLAWIGQFIGHKIEGRKPSFFDDLRFLLIGPLFVLAFLYRRLNVAY